MYMKIESICMYTYCAYILYTYIDCYFIILGGWIFGLPVCDTTLSKQRTELVKSSRNRVTNGLKSLRGWGESNPCLTDKISVLLSAELLPNHWFTQFNLAWSSEPFNAIFLIHKRPTTNCLFSSCFKDGKEHSHLKRKAHFWCRHTPIS